MPEPRRSDRLFGAALALAKRHAFIPALASFAVVGACALAFAELADEVEDGETNEFDRRVLSALRRAGEASEPIGPAWLRIAAADITALGGWTVLVMVVALAVGFLAIAGRWVLGVVLAASVLAAKALAHGLKLHFDRPRPDSAFHLVDVSTLSFPSGHATMSAVVYLTIGAIAVRALSPHAARAARAARGDREGGERAAPQFAASGSGQGAANAAAHVSPGGSWWRASPRRARLAQWYVLCAAALVAGLVGLSRIFLGVHYPTDVAAGWALGAGWAAASWLMAVGVQTWRSRPRRSAAKPLGSATRP